MPDRLYFAYGSNINLDQMAVRCPSAEVIGPVTLNGYRLAFRAQSGVATIIPAPSKQVKGLLWKLTPACEHSLDLYEGFPHFYYKDQVTVMDKSGKPYSVMAYIMSREFEKVPHMPGIRYYTSIAEGYKQNGMPLKYLQAALNECREEVAAKEQPRFDFGKFKPHKPRER